MTAGNSSSNDLRLELSKHLTSSDGSIRSEVAALLQLAQDKGPSDDDAIMVFWEIYRSTTAPPQESDNLIVQWLGQQYRSLEVPYSPDDDSDVLLELLTFLHVTAARAFKIKQRDGLSEEVVDCLTSVERTMARLNHDLNFRDQPDLREAFASLISAVAVSGIAFVELSRTCHNEHRHSDALHYIAKATRYYDEAVECNSTAIGENGRSLWGDRFDAESSLQGDLQEHLSELDVSLKEASNLFEQIKIDSRRVDDWKQIAEDCEALMAATYSTGVDDAILDESGNPVSWSEYWIAAATWARCQLSPTELQEYQTRLDETAAEDRLRVYFFGGRWPKLNRKARTSIVNADIHMHSKELGQRFDTILNELRIATEAIFHEHFWEPLTKVGPSEWFTELNEFEELKEKIESVSPHPALKDLIWTCNRPFFRKFLEHRHIDCSDIRFLTQSLPSLFEQLRVPRNEAEHDPNAVLSPIRVGDVYKTFLGIGRPGVLPELDRIGQKLQLNRPG